MLKQKTFFRLITYPLLLTVIFTACHSFYEIPIENYKNIDTMNDIKIVYKNGNEFVVEKDDTTNIYFRDSMFVVQNGVNEKAIKMGEVNNIKESRFNIGSVFMITGAIIFIIILMNPRINLTG